MNWLDIAILVSLVIPVFIGLRQGLIKAAFSLAGLIIGILLASNLYEPFSNILGFIPNDSVANILAFVIILVGVIVIATVLARILKLAVKVIMLSWVDHLVGGIFGFLIGFLFWSTILAIWVKFFGTSLVTESFIANILLDKFPLILGLLPNDFNSIRDFFGESRSIIS